MQTIITTIGTSLLSNRERPWAGWRFGSPLPESGVVDGWLAGADPVRASAEVHTWYRLGLLDEGSAAEVRLVHSETPDGRFCAERLQIYASGRDLQAGLCSIEGLTYGDPHTFSRGLRHLVRRLAEEIRRGKAAGEVAIAATGGFKAEIAVANLVGALLGAPVYYIYEQFRELIRMEPLPIALSPDWLREGAGASLLRKLAAEDCLPRSQVASLLKGDGRLEMLVESEDVDGADHVCLNLLGTLAGQLLEAPAVDWPPATNTEPEQKVALQKTKHHRPKGWEAIVEGLARSPFVTFVRYDAAAGQQRGVRPATDNAADVFVVITGDGAPPLGLRAGTTAENAGQRRRVVEHLRSRVRL